MKVGSISGSLTRLVDNTSYLIEGANITITTGSNGAITISSTGGGGGGSGDSYFDSTTLGSIFTSGSAAFVGDQNEWGVINSPADKGTDVFFYVSGSAGSKDGPLPGVSLFSGDMVVSGSFFSEGNTLEVTGTIIAVHGFSGSLTKLTDGTSYLIAGNNISIVSQSNGSIVISNTFTQVDDYFDSTTPGSIFTSGSAAFVGGQDEWGTVDSPADKGSDVFFYVSGSIGSKNSNTPGVALFGGDVVVSGSMFAEGNRFEMSGTLLVTEGISGSLTTLTDGTSYLIAGNNISIVSQSNGSVLISNTFAQVDDFFDSTTPGSIFTSGSAAFVGDQDEWGVVDSPSDKGTDVFFYVSGSIGSKDGLTPGTALFGGDLTVSGSLFAVGNVLEISGTLSVSEGISGSLTTLTDGTSYLVAGNNISIVSQSNGSIKIFSSTPVLIYQPGGTEVDNVYTTWDSLMSAFNQLEGVVFIDIDTSITSPALVSAGTHDMESRAIIRGIQTGVVFPSTLQLPDGAVLKNTREFENLTLDLQGTSAPNFSFDVSDRSIKFSGATYIEINGTQPFANISTALYLMFQFRDNVIINNYAATNRCFLSLNNSGADVIITLIDNVILNNDNFVAGTAGNLYFYHDSSVSVSFVIGMPTNPNFSGVLVADSYLDNAKLIAYDDALQSPSLVASTVQNALDVLKTRWASSTANAIYTTSSVAIKGLESSIDAAADKGTDVFFYVSGSMGTLGGTVPGVSMFGGDVRISGSLLVGTGSVRITSNDIQFGGTSLTIQKFDDNCLNIDADKLMISNAGGNSTFEITGSAVVTQHYAGEVENISAAGSISNTKHTTYLTSTTGAYTVTLADGITLGQLKFLVGGSITGGAGGDVTVTPDTTLGTWVSVNIGSYESATLMWVGLDGWAIINLNGASTV